MTDTYRVPVAVGLLVAVGVLLAVNQLAPDLVNTVIVLLVLYLVATNVQRASALFEAAPRALSSLFPAAPGPTGGGARRR